MDEGSRKKPTQVGEVLEALPNTTFRIKLDSGKIVLVYLGGKMRLHRIRVLIGDKVEVEMDAHEERGRIVRRM